VIYFDLLLSIIKFNNHKPRSAYDFWKADAVNDALCSQPFNNNIVEVNSADNVSFTWNKFISPLNNLLKHLFPFKDLLLLA